MQTRPRNVDSLAAGFAISSLLVCLAAIAVLAVLATAIVPAGVGAAYVADDLDRLGRLARATQTFAADEGHLPPRTRRPAWPARLSPYVADPAVLVSPFFDGDQSPSLEASAAFPMDAAARSDVFNGFADVARLTLSRAELAAFFAPATGDDAVLRVRPSAIAEPSETILVGPRKPTSGEFYMDIVNADGRSGDHRTLVELATFALPLTNGGKPSSNYAMADGSARTLAAEAAMFPRNRWAIDPMFRESYAHRPAEHEQTPFWP